MSEGYNIPSINGTGYTNVYEKKSNVGKGALIGATLSTLGAGGVALYGYSTVGKEINALKGKSVAEMRKYLIEANKDSFFKGSKDSFYQCMKSANKMAKNPLTWLGIGAIGATIGALFGKLSN